MTLRRRGARWARLRVVGRLQGFCAHWCSLYGGRGRIVLLYCQHQAENIFHSVFSHALALFSRSVFLRGLLKAGVARCGAVGVCRSRMTGSGTYNSRVRVVSGLNYEKQGLQKRRSDLLPQSEEC